MLKEIRSTTFLDGGSQRPPIKFGTSLNIVLGSSSGSNSIGKSTFLLIVDFAFGGEQYGKCRDVIENVGPHTIDFCFEFGQRLHHFSRSPVEVNRVWRCDEKYSKMEDIALSEYRKWLADMYELTSLGGSFRGLVSNFIRVYGKNNYDEGKPLSAYPQESQSEGITRLLRLFGSYAAVEKAQVALDEAEKEKKAFTESLRRHFIASASGKKEVKDNEQAVSELKAELEQLEELEHDNLNDLDPMIAEQVALQKAALSSFRRKRTLLVAQKSAIKLDEDAGHFKSTKEFSELLKFFPNADIRRLEEIESFHAGLVKALSRERRQELESIEASIEELDAEISRVQEEIRSVGSASNLTKAVLERYSNLKREIEKLEDANGSYRKKELLAASVRQLRDLRDSQIESALSGTQARINDRLRELNEYVCGAGVSVPRLMLEKQSSYSFTIVNDSGTGSQTRAMALLDLVILEETPLPAIALDTVSSKHISDDHMLKLLQLYEKAGKQVFVSFDKAESYGGGSMPGVIERNTVLKLSEGHELFGSSWAKE